MEAPDRGSAEGRQARQVPRLTTRYFDSHCHLQDAAFDDDRDAALDRAAAAGVDHLVLSADDPEAADLGRALAGRAAAREGAPRVDWAAGLHPHHASRWSDDVRERIAAHLDGGAVALGETGLDYHYLNSTAAEQRFAFAAQLELAAGHGVPVVVHSREAEDETVEILAESAVASERIVLHCFTGSATMLNRAVERGWYVSFSGIVTFPKFPAADLVPRVPDERLLAETDAPYLAPVPHRGRRNEPAFVPATVARLAELRGEDPAETARRTAENARRFYRIAGG